MAKISAATSCLLLTVSAATAQTAPSVESERLLPQWLTGLIAVAGFLFLSFVGLLVKKAWCEEPDRTRVSDDSVDENQPTVNGTSLDVVRRKEDMNAYDNLVIDSSDDKVTAM